MDIQIKEIQNIVYIRPGGDLNIFSAKELEMELRKFIDLGRYMFIFDFADTYWLCSSAIQCLITASKTGLSKGYKVIILNSNENLKRTIDILGLEEFIELKENSNHAEEYFGIEDLCLNGKG